MALTQTRTAHGDTVDVYSDDEFLRRSRLDESSKRRVGPALALYEDSYGMHAIRSLWQHGAFADKSGRATVHLTEFAGSDVSATAAGGALKRLDTLGAIKREVRGKRTFKIELVAMPQRWMRFVSDLPYTNGDTVVSDDERAAVEAFESVVLDVPRVERSVDTQHAADAQLDQPHEHTHYYGDGCQPPHADPLSTVTGDGMPDSTDVDEIAESFASASQLELASLVASSLLTQVVAAINAQQGDELLQQRYDRALAEIDGMSLRLHSAIEASEAARRNARSASDLANARRFEIDGLRKRLAIVEHNLQSATKGSDRALIESLANERFAAMLRERPNVGTHERT